MGRTNLKDSFPLGWDSFPRKSSKNHKRAAIKWILNLHSSHGKITFIPLTSEETGLFFPQIKRILKKLSLINTWKHSQDQDINFYLLSDIFHVAENYFFNTTRRGTSSSGRAQVNDGFIKQLHSRIQITQEKTCIPSSPHIKGSFLCFPAWEIQVSALPAFLDIRTAEMRIIWITESRRKRNKSHEHQLHSWENWFCLKTP